MIEAVSPDSPQYEQVVALGNANSKTLGHLPFAAIEQAAAKGCVLAFVEGEKVRGYALFGKRSRTSDISLTHLCVDQNSRGRGIARRLVVGIVQRNPNRAGIRVSCREDYEAHTMWPHLGFQRLGQKPGRGRDRLPLATWWRSIAARPLFDEPEPEDARMVVAIDTNVLLDILEQRDFPSSLALDADWVAETAELAMTEQSRSELRDEHAGSDDFTSALEEFRTLAPSRDGWQMKLHALQGNRSTARLGGGDLRVVAQAAASDADLLLSRDEGLLRQRRQIEQLTGLSLLSPDDFLLRLHAQGGEHSHQTRIIAASGMCVSTVTEMPTDAELSVYCHDHVGERPSNLRQRLGIATAHGGRIEQLATDSEEPLALGAMYRNDDNVTVTLLRSAAGQRSYTAIRQMVHHLRTIAAAGGPGTIVVDDQTQPSAEMALRDEGFRSQGSAWTAVVRTGIVGPGGALPPELEQIGWDRLTADRVRHYERHAWPSKVFSGNVASYVVPIKPEYARVILGYEEPEPRLFELHLRAAAARDNVYYMSPRHFVEAPARIIWWVSGGGPLGGMRAMSWLDEVDTGDPRRLYRKYRDRGVLDERQVLESAKQPRKGGHPLATALLFSRTEMFQEPVSIARARELCASMETDGYFVTIRRIDEGTVRAFYEEGTRRDD